MSTARNEAGFSLVEALVALAVFATAGIALVELQANSIMTLRKVEAKTLASIVGENVLVQAVSGRARPELGVRRGKQEMGRTEWEWSLRVEQTADPQTLRADVSVVDSARPNIVAATAVAFIPTDAGTPTNPGGAAGP